MARQADRRWRTGRRPCHPSAVDQGDCLRCRFRTRLWAQPLCHGSRITECQCNLGSYAKPIPWSCCTHPAAPDPRNVAYLKAGHSVDRCQRCRRHNWVSRVCVRQYRGDLHRGSAGLAVCCGDDCPCRTRIQGETQCSAECWSAHRGSWCRSNSGAEVGRVMWKQRAQQ